MNRALSTISTKAKQLGLSFDRSQMEQAIQASIFDRRAARAKIIEGLYQRAQFNLDRLNADEFQTLVKSGPGEESEDVLDFVPTMDEKNLTSALGIALTSAAKLEAIDDDGGMTEAKGLLGTIIGAINIVAEGQPRMNPTYQEPADADDPTEADDTF